MKNVITVIPARRASKGLPHMTEETLHKICDAINKVRTTAIS